MAKAQPLNIASYGLSPAIEQDISLTLREEHGAHGLRFLGELATLEDGQHTDLQISSAAENQLTLKYDDADGNLHHEAADSSDRRSVERALSAFAVRQLIIPLEQQTSREDFLSLSDYVGDSPRVDVDPSKWIVDNPFMSDLCRRFPQYGNMVRFLCNERGLFLKVGNQANQRAYWNSSLNGGLPAYKKADPVHEGTFMLHDLFHFVPTDPLLGNANLSPAHRSTYVAHRLLSEASTLVLADMVAVDDAGLVEHGYDIAKRKIFPVYESIKKAQGAQPDLDKLLAANAYFCFTGSTKGFSQLGASKESLAGFAEKYESIFRDDFLWNVQNYDSMKDERDSNPLMSEYYDWLESNTDLPTMHATDLLAAENGELDITRLLSVFRADFMMALNYNKPISEIDRLGLAAQKYLAGQRVAFARFGELSSRTSLMQVFDESFNAIKAATTIGESRTLIEIASHTVNEYIGIAESLDLLLPHEAALYRFSVPLYPIKFVNYEKRKTQNTLQLNEDIRSFINVNESHLTRLLDATRV